jgi:superfamily II DNA/RNA helicase
VTKFSDLGLAEILLRALDREGYETPTSIQAQAIPYLMQGRDLLGIAQTGTGKTAGYVLPMLARLETGRARARLPRSLILAPTRELAAQVEQSFEKYGINHKLSVALLIGGVSFGDQDLKISRGADVLIATPGRLLDHVERGKLLLSGVELLVIDESDRMLDMGFIPDIERICKMIPFTRQTLFFTATMPPEIRRITEAFLHNPEKVEVSRPATTAVGVSQFQVSVSREPHEKRETLRQLLRDAKDLNNAIIFCNRKREVALLHKSLQKHGFSVGALHGDMDQSARTAALDQFRKGEIPLLVASDVAARGLDIPAVSHVFNFDVPHHADDYVHRIGRTGRAGRAGTAISIVTPLDQKSMVAIEKLIGQTIPRAEGSSEAQPVERDATPPGGEQQAREGTRDGAREGGREGSRNGRKPRRDREPRRSSGGGRHSGPQPQAPAAAFTPPSPPPVSRAPSIGRAPAPQSSSESSSEPADHSHLPAFLLRPVRARV